MAGMNLLVLVHRLPCPLDRGAKLRSSLELRWLTQRHNVWCAGFIDPPDPADPPSVIKESLADLRSRCRDLIAVPLRPMVAGFRSLLALLTGGTATEGYFASRALRRQVLAWSREVRFDAVLVYSSSMAPLALEIPAGRRVLDLVDLDSHKWREMAEQGRWPMSLIYGTEARRLGQRELEWMNAFDASVLCTGREVELLGDEPCREKVHVIATGAAFEIDPQRRRELDERWSNLPLPAEPRVGFLGAMDYPPNADGVCWFAEAMWPEVLRRCPDARWTIVGRSPTRAVRELADGDRIEVTGTVPAVEPYVEAMRVNVAPLRLARGVQTKVLMAMDMGRPCVVTSCVAAGIGAEAGREILVADSPAEFVEAVVALLRDAELAAAIGSAGREFVKRRWDPVPGLMRLESLLTGVPCDEGDEDRVEAGEIELAKAHACEAVDPLTAVAVGVGD